MSFAVVLSGGTGTRMNLSVPKQYVEVGGKPIIGYSIDLLQNTSCVQGIIIVCHKDWKEYLESYVKKNAVTKCLAFALSGETRQESILNGLIACKKFADKDDTIIIQDAARPLTSMRMIEELSVLEDCDGKMPVLPVKDTVYYSEDGKSIGQLLIRKNIFAGQAPESFHFGKYLSVNESVSRAELLSTSGSSEIAFRHGMNIKFIGGDENNYKITTPIDLEKFREYIERKQA